MRSFATTSILSVFGLFTTQTNAEIAEYWFSTIRCTDKQATYPNFGQPSLCDASCEGTDDPTVGCSWSYPLGDPLTTRSDDAACRCNQRPYRYATHVKPPHKCNSGAGCADGEQCLNSWDFYLTDARYRVNRCKGPLTGSEHADAGPGQTYPPGVTPDDDTPDDSADPEACADQELAIAGLEQEIGALGDAISDVEQELVALGQELSDAEEELDELKDSRKISSYNDREAKILADAAAREYEDEEKEFARYDYLDALSQAAYERSQQTTRNPGTDPESQARVSVTLSDNCQFCKPGIDNDPRHQGFKVLNDGEEPNDKIVFDNTDPNPFEVTLTYLDGIQTFTGFSVKVADFNNRDPSSITAKWTDSRGAQQQGLTRTPTFDSLWQESITYDLPSINVDTITFVLGPTNQVATNDITVLAQIKMYGPDLATQAAARQEVADGQTTTSSRYVYNQPAGGPDFTGLGSDCTRTDTITTASGYVADVASWEVENYECCLEAHEGGRPAEGYMRAACRQEATEATYNPATGLCTAWWDIDIIYDSEGVQLRKVESKPALASVCCAAGVELDDWVLNLTC